MFDILQAADRIGRFVAGQSFAEYSSDELVRSGVERQFLIIGEALSQLRRDTPALVPVIREHVRIIGFRNVLVHGYAEIDDAVVWSVLKEKLPMLVDDVRALMKRLEASS